MEYFLRSFREADLTLSTFMNYLWDLVLNIWYLTGITGVIGFLLMVFVIGMRSADFGYYFSIVAARLTGAIGMVVSAGFTICQKVLIFAGFQVASSAVRGYGDKVKSLIDGTTNVFIQKSREKQKKTDL